ncbi:unnamed protein product [Gongylonema pulchrum]|uniref:DUF148 domain-containing protein n=1 Tax=Gongylonema pulchrum TaxID=637853 RepID=A0A183EEZ4_9BILA|nr:unnamed protein product [Gongylonema pulchrum]
MSKNWFLRTRCTAPFDAKASSQLSDEACEEFFAIRDNTTESLEQLAEKLQQWAKQQGSEVEVQVENRLRKHKEALMKALESVSALQARDDVKEALREILKAANNYTLSAQEQWEHKDFVIQGLPKRARRRVYDEILKMCSFLCIYLI